jgi:hypothetical protein
VEALLGEATIRISFYWRMAPKEWRIQCWRWNFDLDKWSPEFGTTVPTTIPLDEDHLEALLLAIRTAMLAMDPALEMTMDYGTASDEEDQAAGRKGHVEQQKLL